MNDPVYNVAFVNAFFALQMFGAIAFAFIVLSACIFRAVKRQPIWFSFCISWIVYCLSYSFLVFSGQQHREHPERNVCVAQAALIYGAPLIAATATFCLVAHLLNAISAFSHSHKPYPILTAFLIWFPWLIWIITVVAALVIGLKHLDHVGMNPQRTYCEIKNTFMPKVVAGWVIMMGVAMLCVEVIIARALYLNRAIKNALGQSMALAIRICIFTIVTVFGAVLGGVFDVIHIEFDIIISILPSAAVIIFGTQTDLMEAWMFWTWNRKPTMTSCPPVILTTTIEISKA